MTTRDTAHRFLTENYGDQAIMYLALLEQIGFNAAVVVDTDPEDDIYHVAMVQLRASVDRWRKELTE